MDIRSEKCSVCGKPFAEGDDVVVCPECGAPYHRSCYEKAGACVFRARHGSGFSYETQHRAASVRCANCGANNDEDALFCINCGTPMRAYAPDPQPETPPRVDPIQSTPMGVAPMPAAFDGIPTSDWAQYIGNSAQYYLLQFQRMDYLGRRTSFCWSALLVPPAYFLYRRMWGWGILAAALTVLFNVPAMLLMAMQADVAVPFTQSALETLSMICFYLNGALSFVCGLYAFWLYRRHAAKRLSDLRSAADDEHEYRAALLRESGPSMPAVLVLLVLLSVLTALFFRLIGYDPAEFLALTGQYPF